MKILHILSQHPAATGSGIYLQAMLREAKERGHTNFLIAGISSKDTVSTYPNHCISTDFVEFDSAEIPFALPGMSDVMPYRSSRFSDLTHDQLSLYENAFTRKIETVINRNKPDVIHSHHLWLVSSLIRRTFPHLPLVTSCHGSDLRQFQLCPHLQHRVAEGCRKIDKILALTDDQKSEILKHYQVDSDKIDRVGAGFTETLFNFESKVMRPPFHLLYCGKLSRAKGVIWMLRALASITAPLWHLHIVGDGSGNEKQECLDYAAKLGNKVTLHGSLPQAQLACLMKQSHILVLPSLFEGLPLVILEALSCGCRVIATNLPGCAEIKRQTRSAQLSLISLPNLHHIDRIDTDNEEAFISRLRNALVENLYRCLNERPLDPAAVKSSLRHYTWQEIFTKVEKRYALLSKWSP